MATIFIGAGRKQKTRPTDILGALIGEAGLKAEEVGKFEIHDNFSYVAVRKELSLSAVKRLLSGRIKGRRFRIELVR